MGPPETILRRFYRAAIAGDLSGLRASLSEDAFWEVSGSGPLSGHHSGRDAVIAYFASLRQPPRGEIRPFGEDSVDILVGEHHYALVDCLLLLGADGRVASHQVWIVSLKEGRIGGGYQYAFDPGAFDSFFEAG